MRTKTLLISAVMLVAPVFAFAQATSSPTFISPANPINPLNGQSVSSSSMPMCPAFIRSMSQGSQGDDVKELQQFLAGRGFFTATATGYYGPITAAAVSKWQVSAGVVSAGNAGLGYFGPVSRAFLSTSCGVTVVGGGTGTTTATTTQGAITQIQASASVPLMLNGIAEVRNEQMYFTLTNLTSDSATIQITPVGCWNSFPSDTPPQIRCMLALLPIAPQTLKVGETYTAGTSYSITLTKIANSAATFEVKKLGS